MAGLSVAQQAALAQMVEALPEAAFDRLVPVVGTMPGERARDLEALMAQIARDRARRSRGLAPLLPLFRPRKDGVAGLSFPPQVLPRLWKVLAARQADLLPHLDLRTDYRDNSSRVAAATVRLTAAAAAAVRDQPEAIWPPELGGLPGGGMGREEALVVLAEVCDLGGLAQRALPSLGIWTGRPDADRIAEFRLLLRDADTIVPDGTQRLLEILFAHLEASPLLLRLVVIASKAGGRGSILSGSELAPFVERLIEAAEARLARVATYRLGAELALLRADLDWIASFLTETEGTLQIEPGSAWSLRLRQIRAGVSKTLGQALSQIEAQVERALPMQTIKVPGQGRRELPDLDAEIDAVAVAEAKAGLDLVRMVRTLGVTFGCDGQRQALVADLTLHLTQYADRALEEIHAGAGLDAARAGAWVTLAAGFLERIEAVSEGHSVRRRVAVAGVSAHPVSPRAA